MQELWRFDERPGPGRVIGEFSGTGLRPFYNDRFEMHGFKLPPRMFLGKGTTSSFGRR